MFKTEKPNVLYYESRQEIEQAKLNVGRVAIDKSTRAVYLIGGFDKPEGVFDFKIANGNLAERIEHPLVQENAELKNELETERLRLAACGVVAMANTPESAKKQRQINEKYRSASLDDVIRAVDEEIKLRDENAELRAHIERFKSLIDDTVTFSTPEGVRRSTLFRLHEASFQTPAQSLAEIQAQAIEEAKTYFIAAYPEATAYALVSDVVEGFDRHIGQIRDQANDR